MRSIAVRLVAWLCHRYSISFIDETRRSNGQDAVAIGETWHTFAVEKNGLYDMIDSQRRQAFEAYADTKPGDHAQKEYLAMQDRCWRQIKARVDAIIQNGRIEADRKRQNAAMQNPIRKSV